MLWGIVTRSNVDFAELLWEEFVQAIHIFFAHRANLNIPTKKTTPHVIPYCRFTKLIIYYLGSKHNLYKRPGSLVHVTGDDFPLGNLKFVPKGEKDEVFGKPIPKELITDSIQNSPYYQQYLEMVARKPTAKKGEQKKTTSKADKTKKPAPAKQPTLAKQTKQVKEKTSKPTPSKKIHKGKVMKVHKEKRSDRLVDEEPQPVSEPQIEDDEYNLQRGIQISLESFQVPVGGVTIREHASGITQRLPVVKGKGKGIVTDEQDDTSANVVRDTPSPANAETGVDTENSNSEGDTEILNVDEERDPGNTLEYRPLPDEDQAGSNPGQRHVALAGPNPEPMHEDFVAIVYPQVHESLKHKTEEHFLNDKPTEEEPGKANVETEVESMVTVPIHQASSSAPPLSTSVIDLSPPKPTSDPALAARVTALEQICANLAKKNKLQDQTTQGLSSRIFTLENHDLYSKIDNYINETVKEAVQNALQAPVRERFRELLEFEMKEILRDRMFESGSYRSQPEHTTLYDALEASIDCENREEFVEATAKSRKRRCDEQDPPSPPLKYSDQNKKKRHDSDTSAAKHSSKQKTTSQSEQPVEDVPIPDDVHFSNSEDTRAVPPNNLPETENNWANAIAKAYKDPEENKLIWKTRDIGSFIKWYCKQIGKSKLRKTNLEGPAFKLVRPFHKNNISLQFQMEECHLLLTDQIDLVNLEGNRVVPNVSKPLPLGGPPGQLTIQPQYFFNKDLEYLASGDKERRNALSISKLKATYYQDFGLEELVPSLSHMKILSVVILKTFSRYGYTFLREIVLHRADYKEYKISEADFKNLHPRNFKDLSLIWCCQSSSIQRNDYTILHKPRAVIYRDKNNQKKVMRESEVHKFSDDTLTRILEKLGHMFKDYVLFKFNPDMEHRIWSEDDKRRSKEFIEVIERRLKIRRIFRSLESVVSGRLRDVDYRLIQRTE
ncbi:hypothetical protein Tco_0581000 [Tanacetum coccineum]